jgi:hypothetical protein
MPCQVTTKQRTEKAQPSIPVTYISEVLRAETRFRRDNQWTFSIPSVTLVVRMVSIEQVEFYILYY